MKKIKSEISRKYVTPEIADNMLQNLHPNQRPIRARWVKILATDMLSGRWRETNDAIVLINGLLANGQHRLRAVIQSNKSQSFYVMETNDDEAYKILDGGKPRTTADALCGSYTAMKPAIAGWVRCYELNLLTGAINAPSQALSWSRFDHTDYCIEHNALLEEAASVVMGLYPTTKLLTPSIAAALYVIAVKRNLSEKVIEFLTQLFHTGGASSAGELRNRLTLNKGSKAKLKGGYIFGLTIKAFKSYCNGTTPGTLKWAEGETLPRI